MNGYEPGAERGRSNAESAKPEGGLERLRVVIIDPDPLARRVIRDALQNEEEPGFVVPAEAASAQEAIELCRYYQPDIALMELNLADGSGIATTRRIAREIPETRILIFSRESDVEVQLEVLAAGACGYVPKSADVSEVVQALRSIMSDEAVIPPMTTMSLIQRLRVLPEGGTGMRPVKSTLTQREWEILDLMSQGLNTHEMSEALVLAEETIYSHVKNILRKLNVHSRRDAVQAAQLLRDPIAGFSLENQLVGVGAESEGMPAPMRRRRFDPAQM